MQGLEGDVELVGPDLEAPGVGGDRRDLGVVQPIGGGERQARGGPTGVGAPALAAGARVLAGAHADDVAAPDRDALGGDGPLEVLGGDREAVGQLAGARARGGAEGTADVEQHPAPGEAVGGGLDTGDAVARAGDDVRGGAAVPGVAVVEDVPEPVPLGRALQRHGDDVVGAAEPVRELAVEGLATGVEHRVHGVGAPPPPTLRPVHVERLRQRERRTPADEACALDALGVVEEVQGAQNVVGTPAAPVRDAGDGGGDGVLGLRRVEARREDGAGVAAGRLSRHCWSLPRTRCVLPHRAGPEHYPGTRTWRCGVWRFPMGER